MPHSEICGSKVAHTSPQLIAACHVLHRLCMPRHPPNALTSRLKIHTTNDSTARLKCSLSKQCFYHHQLAARSRAAPKNCTTPGYGIDFKKPIHNVKDGRRHVCRRPISPIPEGSGKLVASSWKHALAQGAADEIMVEPIGIEPMTSSLQS